MKLSDEQIQRLNDAGFKRSLQDLKKSSVFDKLQCCLRLHIHLSNGCEICFEMAYTRSRDKKFLHEEMRNACYLKDKMKHAKRR